MFVLGGVIVQFVRARDYRYYLYTVIARSFIVVVMTALYFKSRDPLFRVLDAIVLIGLLPSIYVAAQSASPSRHRSDVLPGNSRSVRSSRRCEASTPTSTDHGEAAPSTLAAVAPTTTTA
jgi:hypothetical protein